MHQLLMTAPIAISVALVLASVAVALVGRRYRQDLKIRTALPAAYLALHGAMGLAMWIARDLGVPRERVGTALHVLDILAALLLALTLLDAHQAVQRMRTALRTSRETVSEYERARRDYEQLVRHRIANPLAVVDGGIDTLLRYEDRMDAPTRRALLTAMAESSRRLREFTPDPTARTIEEVHLHATPRVAAVAS